MSKTVLRTVLLLSVLPFVATTVAAAGTLDPSPAWPLCGRITEPGNTPVGWTDSQGCPSDRWGDPDVNDLPIADPYGPRVQGDLYEFHHGIDIPTAFGTPVFAVAAGEVDRITVDTIQLVHPSALSCMTDGCYFTRYVHLSQKQLSVVGQQVAKGAWIGASGYENSPHLHFELRWRPEDPDVGSLGWQREAIHPLRLLPHPDQPADVDVTFVSIDTSAPLNPVVDLAVSLTELDLVRVEVGVFELLGDGTRDPVVQPGATPNAAGYPVAPPWVDFEERNFLYSHKDSLAASWESFATCPYAGVHPPSYTPEIHVDQRLVSDVTVGSIDGNQLLPEPFNEVSPSWDLGIRFLELVGIADSGRLCLVVRATDTAGNTEEIESDGCRVDLFSDGFETGNMTRWSKSVP